MQYLANKSQKEIPRVEVTTEELISIGHINVFHYKSDQRGNSFTSMRLKKFQELIKMNTTWKVDILIKVLWPLKSPMPGWSGLVHWKHSRVVKYNIPSND